MTQEVPSNRQIKVLVVDDTATNRQILQVFLKRLGFAVITADDGAQAVQRFTDEGADLILMDVMMPVMDGYEATRRIKAISAGRWVPVVFLSALDKEENLVAGLDAGGDDYLSKPVNFVILDAKLRSLVRTLDLQSRLEHERHRVAAITDNIVDGVVTIDESGVIEWCNPSVDAMFGMEHEELIGHNVSRLMPEPHRSAHDGYLRSYLDGGMPRILGMGGRLVTGVRSNGETFPLELGVSEMRLGKRRQFVGILRDITERIEAEAALTENAERLQRYHDSQETENELAQDIVKRQMVRAGLSDPQVHHWVSPAANFSGDIVAASRGPEGALYVMLADATGHGLGAAICTLPVLAVFYSLAETGAALAWIVSEINKQLAVTMPVGRFVAASLLCINQGRAEAEIWLGGTPDLLLIDQAGAVKHRIAATHLPLGIMELNQEDALPSRIALEPNDQFVLFSDGLMEATNAAGEEFGFGLLSAALASAPFAGRLDAVRDSLIRHVGAGAPHDDVSLLIIDCV